MTRQVEIEVKYAGYIKRERERIETAQSRSLGEYRLGLITISRRFANRVS